VDSKTGEVLIPFGESTQHTNLILGDSTGFASVSREQFTHLTEHYTFTAGMHMSPEASCSLQSPLQSPLTIHPHLTLHGWPVPLKLLQDVSLSITTVDASGSTTTHIVQGLDFASAGQAGEGAGAGAGAFVQMIQLPKCCVRVTAVINAKVRECVEPL
jgi:hypothetical protein